MDEMMIEKLAAAVATVATLAEEGAIPADVAEAIVAALEAVKEADPEQGAKVAAALLEAVAMMIEDGEDGAAEAEAVAE